MEIHEVPAIVETWPIEERFKLAEELWNRLSGEESAPGLDASFKEELDRRLAEDESSPDDVVSWEEVKAQALSRARR